MSRAGLRLYSFLCLRMPEVICAFSSIRVGAQLFGRRTGSIWNPFWAISSNGQKSNRKLSSSSSHHSKSDRW